MATRAQLSAEVAALRDSLQVCQSRIRTALRTLDVLQKRMRTMDASIESASIIFTHIHDAQSLLEGEVIHG
jgi:hypothetical protein